MALMELAKAKRALFETMQNIETLQRTQDQAVLSLRNEESLGIDVARHKVFSAYLQGLGQRITMQNDRLIELSEVVREKQKTFEAHKISRESLELLRQNNHRRYLKELGLAEQKAADELMSLRWRPKQSSQQV
jgi:flagellar export protein FliJ